MDAKEFAMIALAAATGVAIYQVGKPYLKQAGLPVDN